MRTIRIGTRGSALALWQTEWLVGQLRTAHPEVHPEVVVIRVQSDRDPETPIPAMGGRGVFTGDIEQALLEGRIDAAVHSLKDLPSETDTRLALAATSPRDDPRDVLLTTQGLALGELRAGSTVGTSSVRRQALLRHARPDCATRPLRGNIDTRVRKLLDGDYDAVVMAAAAVNRLGLAVPSVPLEPDLWVPAVSQGTIGVQSRADDLYVMGLLAGVSDAESLLTARAERELLRLLGGGCSVPLGALAEPDGELLQIRALVAAPDGSAVIRAVVQGRADEPEALAEAAARELARQGAVEIIRTLRETVPLLQGAKGEG